MRDEGPMTRRTTGGPKAIAANAAAFWFLGVFPVLGVLFNRGHMGIAAIGLAVCAGIAVADYGSKPTLAKMAEAWRPPYASVVWAVLFLCALAMLSAMWAFDGPFALQKSASLFGVLLIAAAAGAFMSGSDPSKAAFFGFSGLLLASLFLAEEAIGPAYFSSWKIFFDHPQWAIGTDGNARLLDHYLMQLNRSVVTVSILLWPVGFMLWHRGRRIMLALLLLIALPAIAMSFSQSAIFGLAAGSVAALATMVVGRIAVYGLAAAIMVLAAEAPLIFKVMPGIAGDFLVSAAGGGGAGERLVIWEAFAESIYQKPILGWGADAGRFFGREGIPAEHVPTGWPDAIWHHPHNGFLQGWVDFGIFGGFAVGAIFAAAALAIARLPAPLRPSALGCLAASAAVTLVSHGLWQTWSLMLMGLAAALFVWLAKTITLERGLADALSKADRPCA
ncbi:MAG: O-antigen ligase family protein [Rhodobiaceae bacterium]|nr:O-antigen ligase family protein [Rhodobiaceae bacterium]